IPLQIAVHLLISFCEITDGLFQFTLQNKITGLNAYVKGLLLFSKGALRQAQGAWWCRGTSVEAV
ncbi:MAG: hypothetical protein ACR2PW_01890, partial [Gammaproteobacteria bacterium]